MKEKIFIQKAKEHVNLEEFIRKQFAQVKCGSIDVQYTPIVTRIIIHTVTPGLVIGAGGERIRETVELIKEKFSIENPQIDVQKIENPNLDPYVVAKSIVTSIENGINYKRLGNFYMEKIMGAGAIGCEIVLSGKFSGQRARRERFIAGYLKKCGEPSERDVLKGFAVATPKLGNTGVSVKIMLKQPTHIIKEVLVDSPKPPEEAEPAEAAVKEEGKKKKTKKKDGVKEVAEGETPAEGKPKPEEKKEAPKEEKKETPKEEETKPEEKEKVKKEPKPEEKKEEPKEGE